MEKSIDCSAALKAMREELSSLFAEESVIEAKGKIDRTAGTADLIFVKDMEGGIGVVKNHYYADSTGNIAFDNVFAELYEDSDEALNRYDALITGE